MRQAETNADRASRPGAPMAPLPKPISPAEMSLVRLVGADAAFALIEAHGGARIAIPQSATDSTALTLLIGHDAARIISERHGGEVMKVPLGRAWRAIVYRMRDRLSYTAIARRIGASESSVHAWLREAGATTRANKRRDARKRAR